MPHLDLSTVKKLRIKNNIKGLIKALGYKKDLFVRQAAANALGEIGDRRAVKPLTAALRDRNAPVRQAAASSLGKICDHQAVEPLIATMGDGVQIVRRAAVHALGEIGDPKAVGSIVTVLKERDATMRKVAAEALGKINNIRTLKSLIAALNDADQEVRSAAADALVNSGELAVEPLVSALSDADQALGEAIVAALVRIGPPAIKPLAAALGSERPKVCRLAAEALDRLCWQPDPGEAGAVYWIVRRQWKKCVEIGTPAVRPLIAALRDTDANVRQAAARTLGYIGDKHAIEPLVAALGDENALVRQAIDQALKSLHWQPGKDKAAVIYWICTRQWHKCIEIGTPAVEPLVAALKNANPETRSVIHETLSRIRSDISQQQWFFRKSGRPQLLEIVEAPLTSIYGSRIACWTFYQSALPTNIVGLVPEINLALARAMRKPVRLAVTGHGPNPVCARVSAILNDLANERNCPADLVLAGVSFFDLTADLSSFQRREKQWDQDELLRRIRRLAAYLGMEEVLLQSLGDPRTQRLLDAFAVRALGPTIDIVRESMAHVETEMGFVVNRDVDQGDYEAVLQALGNRTVTLLEQGFPVLVEYQHNGKPLRLRLSLDYVGLEDYERVVHEYRRSVCEEMRQEWERRRSKYEEWSRQFASRYCHFREELARSGPHLLSSRVIYITYEVDPETATEVHLDPPKPTTELEYLGRLPLMIIQQLAYWAWAEYRTERLPEPHEFSPHWAQTCLIDAFLRGWPLPTEDERLNAIREQWQEHWRLPALIALDDSLQEQGLTLADIAVENTVFRVVGQDGRCLVLGVLHVWDPQRDPPPQVKGKTLLFVPSFGRRARDLKPAKVAQAQAVELIQRAVAGVSASADDLQRALLLDSGAATDWFIEQLCQPSTKGGLESDIERVMQTSAQKADPLVVFGLQKRFAACSTVQELLQLARACGDAGREKKAIPDFPAWELYLVGEAVRNTIHNLLKHMPLASFSPTPRGTFGGGWPELPPGIEADCLYTMSNFTPWQIVAELIQPGQCIGTVKAILEFLASKSMPARIRDSYQLLITRGRDYVDQCWQDGGLPPRSRQRETRYAPGCLSGWDRVCYDIAKGDAALGFAWAIRERAGSLSPDTLETLLATALRFPIPATFEHLAMVRNQLIKEVEKFRRGDPVSLRMAAATVRRTMTDVLALAESAYEHAALQDAEYGCGWLRLARLKWLIAHYREALSILVGPYREADLQACQLPLALAVRVANGHLTVTGTGKWNGSANMTITISRSEGGLALDFTDAAKHSRKCVISGLPEADVALLEQFFQKYRPDMLRSAGTMTFEEWMRLIQVPNLGKRGTIANVVRRETEFAVLAACVYLGVPDKLGLPPGAVTKPRPSEWLAEDVIVALKW